jgi:hypothetical protein
MAEQSSELPQDRWFWVWLSIFSILLGTSPFIIWEHPWWGSVCGITGLAGLLVLIRDRLKESIKGLPIQSSLKVLAAVALSILLGQLMGYDIYGHHAMVAPYPTHWWGYGLVLLPIAAAVGIGLMIVRLARTQTEPSKLSDGANNNPKLVIHRAVYAAGLPTEVSVTDKLQKIERGGIAITVDGTLGGLIPDPAFGVVKRLDVDYSYGTDTVSRVSRTERPAGEIMRLVLPEDTEVKRLAREIQQLIASQPKPAQYPIPQLRGKVLVLVSELQGFLDAHGGEPEVKQQPQEETGAYLRRHLAAVAPWRAKVLGDYRLSLDDSVRRLQDEIRSRAGINDLDLNAAVTIAANNPNGCLKAIEEIIERFWCMALGINV